MDTTPNLDLSLIANKQGLRSIFHDDAMKALDTLVMLSVLDRDLSSPPASPDDGDRYIVKSPGSGDPAWIDDHVVVFMEGHWTSHAPKPGWTCYVQDEGALLAWNGTAWAAALEAVGAGAELQNLAKLGVGTTADATNPLAAKLNNALFTARTVAEGGDGSLRYKLSKESASNTVSFLYQDNFSGCAEIGLTGDDDFHFKVSPDGSTWVDAIIIDRSSGAAKIGAGLFLTGDVTPAQITADQNDYNPTGLAGAAVLRVSTDASRNVTGVSGGGDGRVLIVHNVGTQNIVLKDELASSSAANRFALSADLTLAPDTSALLQYDSTSSRWRQIAAAGAGASAGRELLTANRTYYVRTDGGDSNNGLSNSSGGAFLTIQKAVDTLCSLDMSTFTVTIQVADGTYSGTVSLRPYVGTSQPRIQGNTTTPDNVVISRTGGNAISGFNAGYWKISGCKVTTTTSGSGVNSSGLTWIDLSQVNFGAVADHQMFAQLGATINIQASYTISGGAAMHMRAQTGGTIVANGGLTITLSGTPAYAGPFVYATSGAFMNLPGETYSGSATGTRYSVTLNAGIDTGGGGANYFPGNAAGSTATGGQYA